MTTAYHAARRSIICLCPSTIALSDSPINGLRQDPQHRVLRRKCAPEVGSSPTRHERQCQWRGHRHRQMAHARDVPDKHPPRAERMTVRASTGRLRDPRALGGFVIHVPAVV